MKKILFVLIFFTSVCEAQIKLSEKSQISVITCGPGQQELYSAFGHSAFRVEDPVNQIDEVYNYGVFDFKQKNFYLNFARGRNNYRLAAYDYRDFEYSYIYHNRFIHQQILNLDEVQKQQLYDYLQWNNQPENQFYRYDYFYDNCATRIRDVVERALGTAVKFDSSYITTDYSIRELTDIYLEYQPWGDFGIDICLGLPMDKKASPYEYMFLPDYIESSFDHATIQQDEVSVPLVSKKLSVFEPKKELYSRGIFPPLTVFTGLFLIALALSYRDFRRKKLSTLFDVVFFSILGMLGLLFLLLWIATDHKAAAKNFNLLWALPTHLIAVIAFIRQPRWLEKYFLVTAILAVVLLASWPLLPQMLHYALVPIVMTAGLRSVLQYYVRKRSSLY